MNHNNGLGDVSDGKLYDVNDMVKADTRGCQGCSACCHDMDIALNPYDIHQIKNHEKVSFEVLLEDSIELHEDGRLLLPYLKMSGKDYACSYLNEEGRCLIHGARPGICRLFPLGRYYEGSDFKYVIKPGECVKADLSKIKVKKWIGIGDYQNNKAFILQWHGFLKTLKWRVKFIHDEEALAGVRRDLLDTFYMAEIHESKNFYQWFEETLPVIKDRLGVL